jgi:adenylate cyclase
MLYLIAMASLLRRAAKGLAIALVSLVAVIFLTRSALFSDLDRLTYDFTVDHAGLSAPSPNIVLIDFDEDTYQRIHRFPVPRSYFTDAINRIAAAKPRVIGLDVLLAEPQGAERDQQMQQALTNAGNVVLASLAPEGQLPATMPLPEFCQPENAAYPSGFCVEGKPGAMAYAAANMPNDDDGFVREANLFFEGNPQIQSYPLMLAQQYAGESIKPGDKGHVIFLGHRIPYLDPVLDTILIGAWGREPATRIPAWKLLTGQVPPQALTDKLVLIGQSHNASSDTHLTPLFRMEGKDNARLKLPGTAIHAAAIRTLLERRTVQPASRGLAIAYLALATVVAATLLLACDLSLGLAALLGLMVLAVGISLLLYAKFRFWLPFMPVEIGLALTLPLTLGLRFIEEQLTSREAAKQREQLMGLFSSYVDPAVAETIWQRRTELSLNGEEHVATVMFTDIRGFTALSANQPPAIVLGWLNRYVVAMDEVIREHGGFLNKFIGDGLMIIFGLPLGHGEREDARRGLEASLAMLKRVDELNEERATNPHLPHLRIGIGIHTGSLMAGSIGSANRQEYSVIGETVNLASRLESLNKQFGTEILMSEATMGLVADLFPGLESLGDAKVAGLQDPVPVYTLRAAALAGNTAGQIHETMKPPGAPHETHP